MLDPRSAVSFWGRFGGCRDLGSGDRASLRRQPGAKDGRSKEAEGFGLGSTLQLLHVSGGPCEILQRVAASF